MTVAVAVAVLPWEFCTVKVKADAVVPAGTDREKPPLASTTSPVMVVAETAMLKGRPFGSELADRRPGDGTLMKFEIVDVYVTPTALGPPVSPDAFRVTVAVRPDEHVVPVTAPFAQ